jgi:hypothetical protein
MVRIMPVNTVEPRFSREQTVHISMMEIFKNVGLNKLVKLIQVPCNNVHITY